MVELLQFPMVVIAGLIAFIGFKFNTKYKFIGLLLFIDFLFMTGYEELVINSFYFDNNREYAPFYGYKFLIQAAFTIGYIHLCSKAQARIGAIIMVVLGISVAVALSNMDAVYYEGVMVALSICQLIAGMGGALGGYCNISDYIRGRFTYRRRKTLSR